MKTVLALTALMGLIILPTGCATAPRGFPSIGINNFDKVDDKLMRGSQPNHAGIEWLVNNFHEDGKPLTVINLRGSDTWVDEPASCKKSGVVYQRVELNPLAAPTKLQMETILQLITSAPGRVFVHCQFGCDRTGTVVACYRIRYGTMSNADALNDAKTHGLSSWETGMIHFITNFK